MNNLEFGLGNLEFRLETWNLELQCYQIPQVGPSQHGITFSSKLLIQLQSFAMIFQVCNLEFAQSQVLGACSVSLYDHE